MAAVLVLVLRAAAMGEDALVPNEVGHGLEQLQDTVARIGGGGLRDVKHPRNRTHQQIVPPTIGPLVLLLLSPLPLTTLPPISLALCPP